MTGNKVLSSSDTAKLVLDGYPVAILQILVSCGDISVLLPAFAGENTQQKSRKLHSHIMVTCYSSYFSNNVSLYIPYSG